jgi:hypothetical protein
MKFISVLFLSLILAGCSVFVPVKPPKFPDAPEQLRQNCNKLKTIDGDNVSITDMLKVVVENYTMYYECSTKVEGWNEWYVEQKKIMDKVSK